VNFLKKASVTGGGGATGDTFTLALLVLVPVLVTLVLALVVQVLVPVLVLAQVPGSHRVLALVLLLALPQFHCNDRCHRTPPS
jgi:hypothetical protein